jgi:hypothetical protein
VITAPAVSMDSLTTSSVAHEVPKIPSCSVSPEEQLVDRPQIVGLGDQPIYGHADIENDPAHDHILAHHRDVVS